MQARRGAVSSIDKRAERVEVRTPHVYVAKWRHAARAVTPDNVRQCRPRNGAKWLVFHSTSQRVPWRAQRTRNVIMTPLAALR